MTKRIWKVTLKVEARQPLWVPEGAEFLSVGIQNDHPVVWFRCDPDAKQEARLLRTVTTGEDFNDDNLEFIGSVTIAGFHPVHIFEQTGGVEDDPVDRRAKIVDNHAEARDAIKDASDARVVAGQLATLPGGGGLSSDRPPHHNVQPDRTSGGV